jgi:cytoskeletal protein CcmA (bactofilin family)
MADPGQDFPTIIGPDATFKGELSFEKGLRLQGKFEGKVNTPGRLHVGKEAKLMADVEAGAIILEGEARGNLTAGDRIELKQSCRYEGDLNTTKLVVDEGAVFSGHVSVGPDAVKGNGAASGGGDRTMRMPPPGGRPQGANQPGQQPAKVAT